MNNLQIDQKVLDHIGYGRSLGLSEGMANVAVTVIHALKLKKYYIGRPHTQGTYSDPNKVSFICFDLQHYTSNKTATLCIAVDRTNTWGILSSIGGTSYPFVDVNGFGLRSAYGFFEFLSMMER